MTRQNDDATYNRGPVCSHPKCTKQGYWHVPGSYGAFYCDKHKGDAGYGRGDSMG